MKVLVSGAGIAGAVMARALRTELGWDVAVFDGVKLFRDIGGGINLGPNGLRTAAALGLLDEIKKQGAVVDNIAFRGLDGRLVTQFCIRDVAVKKYGIPGVAIKRSRLLAILTDKAREAGASITMGKRLVGVSSSAERGGGVTCTFDDGSTESGDILIGADGLHSAARAALFGAEKPRYTGTEAIIGVADASSFADHDVHTTNMYTGKGKQFGCYGIGHGQVLWFVGQAADEGAAKESWTTITGDSSGEAARFADLFAQWGLPEAATRLVRKSDRIVRYGIYDRDMLAVLHKGNTVLIGDAAHPFPPHLGMGGNSALEDVGVLVELFRKYPTDPQKCFSIYDKIRKPRIQMLLDSSRQMGKMNKMTNPLACALRDSLTALTVRLTGSLPVGSLYGYDYKAEVAKATT